MITHLDIDDFVDATLLYDFVCAWDSIHRNTLYVSWNKQNYSMLPYDLDCSFGVSPIDIGGSLNPTDNPFNVVNVGHYSTYVLCPWMRVLESTFRKELCERYKKLRQNGVFSIENIKYLCSRWNSWVGIDVYKRDLERWTYNRDHTDSYLDSSKRIIEFMDIRIRTYLDFKYNY